MYSLYIIICKYNFHFGHWIFFVCSFVFVFLQLPNQCLLFSSNCAHGCLGCIYSCICKKACLWERPSASWGMLRIFFYYKKFIFYNNYYYDFHCAYINSAWSILYELKKYLRIIKAADKMIFISPKCYIEVIL